MKKMFLFVVLVVVAVSATFGQVQVVKEKDSQMKTTVDLLLPELAKPAQIFSSASEIFLFHSNKELVRWGDRVELTLISMVSSTERIRLSGSQICRAGLNGEIDGKQGGCSSVQPYLSYSGYKDGVAIGERILVYTRVFNQEDLKGKYTFHTKVRNHLGVDLQFVSVEFYLTDTGSSPRDYFIEKVEIAPDGQSLIATGKFRIGKPYFCMEGVPTQGFVIWGNNPANAAYSWDGVTLHLGAMVWYDRPTYLDVVAQTPGYPTLNKPGAIVAPAYVP